MLASYTVTLNDGTEAGIDHLSRRIKPNDDDTTRAYAVAEASGLVSGLLGVKSVVEVFEAAGSSSRKELYVSPDEQDRRDRESAAEAARWEHRWATQHYLDAIQNARDEMAAATRKLDRLLLELQTTVELPDDERDPGRYERGKMPANVDPYRHAATVLDIISRAPSYVHSDTLIRAAGDLERATAASRAS